MESAPIIHRKKVVVAQSGMGRARDSGKAIAMKVPYVAYIVKHTGARSTGR